MARPDFARNLRALAGLHDLTGTDLAAILGLSRPAVSDLMRGRRQPSLPTLLMIREIFGIGSDLASDPLEELLPTFADPERFRAAENEIAQWQAYAADADDPGQWGRERAAQLAERGTVKPSSKRGKQ